MKSITLPPYFLPESVFSFNPFFDQLSTKVFCKTMRIKDWTFDEKSFNLMQAQ